MWLFALQSIEKAVVGYADSMFLLGNLADNG